MKTSDQLAELIHDADLPDELTNKAVRLIADVMHMEAVTTQSEEQVRLADEEEHEEPAYPQPGDLPECEDCPEAPGACVGCELLLEEYIRRTQEAE